MGSEKKSSKKKKKSSREYSLELGTVSTSNEMERSFIRKSRQSTEDSDESWLKPDLRHDTPAPVPKLNVNTGNKSPSVESDVFSLISPEKLRLHPKRAASVVNIKNKGTGPHDNRLVKSQGDYREPSLRRGSGKPYTAPEVLNKIPATETGESYQHKAQSTELVVGSSSQQTQPLNCQKLSGNDLFAINRPKASRSDVNPVGHRPLAAVKKPPTVQSDLPSKHDNKKEEIFKVSPDRESADCSTDQVYDGEQQKSIIKACLQSKLLYLRTKRTERQKFWLVVKSLIGFLPPSTTWHMLYKVVRTWSKPRLVQLKMGTLAKPSSARMELDTLIDQWNKVKAMKYGLKTSDYVEVTNKNVASESGSESEIAASQSKPDSSTVQSEGKLCPDREHVVAVPHGELESSTAELKDVSGPGSESAITSPQSEHQIFTTEFDDRIWPRVESLLLPLAERRLIDWLDDKLQERMQELESLTRPPLLKADSSPESYHTYVSYLKGRIQATGKNSTSIRETEAVMSMAIDLLPDIKEHLRKELKVEHMDVDEDEDDAEGNGVIHGEGHEECSEEIYSKDSEDDASCYQPSVIDSIEPRTPVVTPRVMAQLRFYESKYLEAARAAKAQKEAEDEALRSLDDNQTKKRKAPDDDTHGLFIRSKSSEHRPVRYQVPETPDVPARKKQCVEGHHPYSSPASTFSSPGLPPTEELFSSSFPRDSSAITQPTPTPAGSGLRKMSKSQTSDAFGNFATSTPKTPARANHSPGLFVTPDLPPSGQSDRLFRIKKSASRNAVLKKTGAYREKAEAPRFREETAEYQAMSPESRDMMMYRAIRDMREKR
ncbi:hypothetical protein ACHAPU_010724 [Fusarium lateritium]